jgi:hypothetical protein
VSEESTNRSFDELARGLASGSISRRKALRLMGAALVGGVLASVPRVAAAQEVCPDASACCSCEYEDPDTSEITRRKCFPQTTRTCKPERVETLHRQCIRMCRENRPRGTVHTGTHTTCARGSIGLQAVCGGGPSRPRDCGFEPCEPPAGAAGAAGGSEEQEGRVSLRSP